MNKSILLLLLSILINSCKSEAIMNGKYQTNLLNESVYTFDMNNHNYSKELSNGTIAKGKFKTFVLSPEKVLIVFNDMILKRISSDVKEANKVGDSIVIGVFDGYKNLGSTIFEITSKEKKILFRKTYLNQLEKTESEGILIKK